MGITKNESEKKWNNIEKGIEKDDYTNHFLSHFGFHDDPTVMEKKKANRDALYAETNIKNKIVQNED